jgi:hypothetical protein
VWGNALTAAGSNAGVYGFATSPLGRGVWGDGTYVGTFGGTDTGAGVLGQANAAGTGVQAIAVGPGGIGVKATAETAVVAEASQTQLRFAGGPVPPLDAGLSRQAGEVVFDTNQDLWLCVAAGNPGTWRRITGPSSAGSLTVLASTARIYDSRPGTQPPTGIKTKYQDTTIRALDATGNSSGVPANAQAVMISATATNTNSGGFFSFYKTGISFPGNSNLNWGLANSTVAVTTVVACGAGATFNSRMQGVGGSDLVVDVIGYYL